MEQKEEFSKWLEIKFIEWMRSTGKAVPQSRFAEYLEIEQMNLSNYLNARRLPDPKIVEKIAPKLGPEVYDVLGLARPDIQLKKLTSIWHTLSDEQIEQIFAIAFPDEDI